MECDVAIIGGGPAGSTVASVLRKYNPHLNVHIFEREKFPRDHVGESLLPPTSHILHEIGVWDKVEAANFPIKLGATYRWGRTPELWHFNFVPVEEFAEQERPAPFEGQRARTAFQVDRSIYDDILLRHAAELGAHIHEEAKVTKFSISGDRIDSFELADGTTVTAKHYVDASGNSGILRRAMQVECDYHPALQNIAIWDYWQNAEWTEEIGVGGTRIQVRSVPYGWLWFIPLGPTRTSIGLIVPADYYKNCGKKPADLYIEALQSEPEIHKQIKNATQENKLETTRDWSFLASRQYGENWFLVGECAGFADPILSAGVTMAHTAALQLAYTINEIEHGGDAEWLKEEFETRQTQRIQTHIRFGDFWYSSNSQFKELQEFTQTLAETAGLELSPEKAWAWIAQGGFIDEDLGIGLGGFDLRAVKDSGQFLAPLAFDSPLESMNVLQLNLRGAKMKDRASYLDGRVYRTASYVRKGKVLPIRGAFELLLRVLENETALPNIVAAIQEFARVNQNDPHLIQEVLPNVVPALEGMISDGWVKASYDPRLPLAQLGTRASGLEPSKAGTA